MHVTAGLVDLSHLRLRLRHLLGHRHHLLLELRVLLGELVVAVAPPARLHLAILRDARDVLQLVHQQLVAEVSAGAAGGRRAVGVVRRKVRV